MKLTIETIDELIKFFESLKIRTSECDIELNYLFQNTGIREVPFFSWEQRDYKQYEDKGGRYFKIEIEIPNHD